MESCYTGYHTAGDYIHVNIIKCNMEEPQKKYRLATVSKRLVEDLKNYFVYCFLPFIYL